MNVSNRNTGTSTISDHPIYRKNDGIWIPFSSAIAFTMKFGAFPIYVFAPMNTAPQEIAVSTFTGTIPRVVASPSAKPLAPAVVKNTR